jgi:deoxyribose-phosphate aldolase
MPDPEARALALSIEHTLLSPTATPQQIEGLCQDAICYGFYAVCVNGLHLALARAELRGRGVRIVGVAAFPLGATSARAAAGEAAASVSLGADEIDLVAPLGLVAAGEFPRAYEWIGEVRRAIAGVPLKLILETGYFESSAVETLAEVAIDAGVDFLKTSTGFGPRGATIEDVQLLSQVARGRVRIKASAGIRTRESALALLAAGAHRIGTSRGVEIVTQ